MQKYCHAEVKLQIVLVFNAFNFMASNLLDAGEESKSVTFQCPGGIGDANMCSQINIAF